MKGALGRSWHCGRPLLHGVAAASQRPPSSYSHAPSNSTILPKQTKPCQTRHASVLYCSSAAPAGGALSREVSCYTQRHNASPVHSARPPRGGAPEKGRNGVAHRHCGGPRQRSAAGDKATLWEQDSKLKIGTSYPAVFAGTSQVHGGSTRHTPPRGEYQHMVRAPPWPTASRASRHAHPCWRTDAPGTIRSPCKAPKESWS